MIRQLDGTIYNSKYFSFHESIKTSVRGYVIVPVYNSISCFVPVRRSIMYSIRNSIINSIFRSIQASNKKEVKK